MAKPRITRVSQLLALASKAKEDDQLSEVMDALRDGFDSSKHLGHLQWQNPEAYLEAPQKPHISFELVKAFSGRYVVAIKPEIRNGGMTVTVEVSECGDGLGLATQYSKRLEDYTDFIEAIDSDKLDALAQKAKVLALALHQQLVEEVGIEPAAAARIVKKAW